MLQISAFLYFRNSSKTGRPGTAGPPGQSGKYLHALAHGELHAAARMVWRCFFMDMDVLS
ncbi:hypothetical protein THIX_70194 [Thiomonas sp. X19]|uniref:hypothetical protein n=1 Tax=Thiomonas sp. X19 TaxID=1050370 RepID=UPI000B741BBE|nr:hypothetical protein [Thiomonas sp. X19]SCC95165.1 hypothetical protein THIX_70194 [Thiomonas sp. X19]